MINEIAKQALVVTQDSDAPQSNRACYIGTDNVAAGRQAGELIKEALPDGGKIMIFVGKSDAQNAQERYQGIKESLAGSKVEIIDLRTDDTDRVRAKANVSDTLVKYPDVACLVGLWSYNGPAIVNALKEAGKIGQVKSSALTKKMKRWRASKMAQSTRPSCSSLMNSAISPCICWLRYSAATALGFRPANSR